VANVTATQLLAGFNDAFQENQDIADALVYLALMLQRGKLDAEIAQANKWQSDKVESAQAYIAERQAQREVVQAEIDKLSGTVDPGA